MKTVKEVVSKLNELLEHAESCWGYSWDIAMHENLAFASETAKSKEESFFYFEDNGLCMGEIHTNRKPEDIESITPYFDDSEVEDEDWSFDTYFVFRGGDELLINSQAVNGAMGYLLEVKSKKIQTQDPEEIQAYFSENR